MKKKIVFPTIFGILLASRLWSAQITSSELWMSTGFTYDFHFETPDSKYLSYQFRDSDKVPGGFLTLYEFWNKNSVGLYLNVSVLFPANRSGAANSDEADGSYDTDERFATKMIFGPAVRSGSADIIDFRMGFGTAVMMNSMNLSGRFRQVRVFVGLGLDLGIRVKFSDSFFLELGARGDWYFLTQSVTHLKYTSESSLHNLNNDWDFESHSFSLEPYIGIGVAFNYLAEGDSDRGRGEIIFPGGNGSAEAQ